MGIRPLRQSAMRRMVELNRIKGGRPLNRYTRRWLGLGGALALVLAFCSTQPLARAQQVGPLSQPVFAGPGGSPVPVSSSSPLPVTCQAGCGGGSTPAPVVTCPAAPNAPCVQITGQPIHTTVDNTTPIPVTTAPPASPAPTLSPNPYPAQMPIFQGSGTTTFLNTACDTYFVSGALTSGTTLQIVAPVAGQTVYVCYAAVEATGAQTAATLNFEWGTGATCGTGTVTLLPVAGTYSAASGTVSAFWAGASQQFTGLSGGPVPAFSPLIVPSGDGVCVVPGGTTVNAKAIIFYAQHAN